LKLLKNEQILASHIADVFSSFFFFGFSGWMTQFVGLVSRPLVCFTIKISSAVLLGLLITDRSTRSRSTTRKEVK